MPQPSNSLSTWHDAITTYIPPAPTNALPCAAPLASTYRTLGPTSLQVPAGTFQAVHVAEIIDICQQPNTPELLVYEIDRWFTAGVGPVQLAYTDSNSAVHEYRLTAYRTGGRNTDLWPLEVGNSWTYEALDATGAAVGTPITVTVTTTTTVTQP